MADCKGLWEALRDRGILNNDFNNTLKSMGVTANDIDTDFDGFVAALKSFTLNNSQALKGKYLSNAKASQMLDNIKFYAESKGGDISKATTDQVMKTQYNLIRKSMNEQKSILWGNDLLGKEWVDSNGARQLFSTYVESNDLHNSVLNNLMKNKAIDGFEKEAGGILDGFRRHIDGEAANLVGTKKLSTADMVKTEYIYNVMDQVKTNFYNMNQTTKTQRSVLKAIRGDAFIDLDPRLKKDFFNFARTELADVLDFDKNSIANIDKFLDDYFFSKSSRNTIKGQLDYNLFDNMNKTGLFSEKFHADFMENPIDYGFNVNSIDVMESVSKRWSRNYGIYDQFGARPFETFNSLLDQGKIHLDNTTYGNVKNIVEKNYVGGLAEELRMNSSSARNWAIDITNSLGNMVLAPRLLGFGIVNIDDLPMRLVMTSAMTGDSAIGRAFLDNKTIFQNAAKDFILDIKGKSAFDPKDLAGIALQQEANMARVLSGNSLDGIPRYLGPWEKRLAVLKDAYNSGGVTKAATAITGSNIGTAGNDSLEKAMVYNSNDIAQEVMAMLKKQDFDPKKAYLTTDALKRNGISDRMLELYKKTDKIQNFADDLSLDEVMSTMAITKDNMNFKSLDYLVRRRAESELKNSGLMNSGGYMSGYQKDMTANRIMDFYMKVKGEEMVPESVLELINNMDRFDFISNGGEIAVRAKKGETSPFNIIREKELEKNFNTAYKQMIEYEGLNIKRRLETEIRSDLDAGRKNKMVENFNKSLNEGRYKSDLAFSELVDSQRLSINQKFENLEFTLFEDHYGLFASSYDSANVLNDLAVLNPKLAVMYRVNTFYKATLGRSNNRMMKLMNASLGDGVDLTARNFAANAFTNKKALLNKQTADMFVAAVVGAQVVNALKSDLQGEEGFLETMNNPWAWVESAVGAPYVASPFGYNYTTSLANAVTAPTSYVRNKITGKDYFAEQDREKFRKAIFSGTGYNMFDNWIMSNTMEALKPDPELGDPFTEIYAYTSRKYRKNSGYQKLYNQKKRQEEKKKEAK